MTLKNLGTLLTKRETTDWSPEARLQTPKLNYDILLKIHRELHYDGTILARPFRHTQTLTTVCHPRTLQPATQTSPRDDVRDWLRELLNPQRYPEMTRG